jgi:hypothetical protein
MAYMAVCYLLCSQMQCCCITKGSRRQPFLKDSSISYMSRTHTFHPSKAHCGAPNTQQSSAAWDTLAPARNKRPTRSWIIGLKQGYYARSHCAPWPPAALQCSPLPLGLEAPSSLPWCSCSMGTTCTWAGLPRPLGSAALTLELPQPSQAQQH